MYAIAQEDFLRAQVGDPEIYRVCNAPLICGSPYEKSYGDLLIKPDYDKARQLLKESGYDGTPIVMMQATDLQSSNQLPPVAKQALEKAGFKVDLQAMDWQTVVARRAKKEAPDKGGWNIFFTTTVTVDADNPAGNSFTSGDCDKAWFGWPCDPEMEKLRSAYARENDPEKRKQIALAVSDRVMDQGDLCRAGPVQGLRRLPQGPHLGLARRPGAGVVEHHQEELTLPPGGRERPFHCRSRLTPPGRAALPASARRLRRPACRAPPWCGSRWRRCPRCPGRHWPAPSRPPRRPAG